MNHKNNLKDLLYILLFVSVLTTFSTKPAKAAPATKQTVSTICTNNSVVAANTLLVNGINGKKIRDLNLTPEQLREFDQSIKNRIRGSHNEYHLPNAILRALREHSAVAEQLCSTLVMRELFPTNSNSTVPIEQFRRRFGGSEFLLDRVKHYEQLYLEILSVRISIAGSNSDTSDSALTDTVASSASDSGGSDTEPGDSSVQNC